MHDEVEGILQHNCLSLFFRVSSGELAQQKQEAGNRNLFEQAGRWAPFTYCLQTHLILKVNRTGTQETYGLV